MTVLYLHGFASSPESNKARFFRQQLEGCGVTVKVPDLAEGDFEHLTITRQLAAIERAAAGESVTLMGSSLGGYLAALYAARHPEVERVVLLAPAFCFGKRFPEMLGGSAVDDWRRSGTLPVFHYGEGRAMRLSYSLIEDALEYEDYPELRQPALILHGSADDVVPVALSEEFVRHRPQARLVVLASGHELTDVTAQLWSETTAFLGLKMKIR